MAANIKFDPENTKGFVNDEEIKAIEKESNPDAKKGLSATLDSMEMSKVRENPLCVDTGWPIFYFKVGNKCEIEGGFVELENAARRAVAKELSCDEKEVYFTSGGSEADNWAIKGTAKAMLKKGKNQLIVFDAEKTSRETDEIHLIDRAILG